MRGRFVDTLRRTDRWRVPPAAVYGDSGVLGFCDGHAEVHKWRDTFTKERVMRLIRDNVDNYGTAVPPPGQQADINYMAQGWAYRF